MHNHANLTRQGITQEYEPVVSFMTFLFLHDLTGSQWSWFSLVQVGQHTAGDVWKGKWLMQIPHSLFGNNTWAPVLCCLLPIALIFCLSKWAASTHYVIFSIWVAAEVPQHCRAKTLSTQIMFILWHSALLLVLGFYCGGARSVSWISDWIVIVAVTASINE